MSATRPACVRAGCDRPGRVHGPTTDAALVGLCDSCTHVAQRHVRQGRDPGLVRRTPLGTAHATPMHEAREALELCNHHGGVEAVRAILEGRR